MNKERGLLQELNIKKDLLAGEVINLTIRQAAEIQMMLATKLLAEHEESKKHHAQLSDFVLRLDENSQVWHFVMGIKTKHLNFSMTISVKNGSDRLELVGVEARKGFIPIPIRRFIPQELYDPTSMWEEEENLPKGSLIITISGEGAILRIKEEYLKY